MENQNGQNELNEQEKQNVQGEPQEPQIISRYTHKGFVINRMSNGSWYIDYAASRLDLHHSRFRTLAKAKGWVELITTVENL